MNKESSSQRKSNGEILKETRESQKISIMTVHEATKIPLDVLKAIEEGYTVRTLSPFYLKGFIKMYAQYLGVDISTVVDDYRREELPGPIEPVSRGEDKIPAKIDEIFTKERQQAMIKGIGVLLALFVLVKIVGAFHHHKPAPVRKPAVERARSTPAVKTVSRAATRKRAAPVRTVRRSSRPSAVVSAGEKYNVRVSVKAKDSVWLQVKADGNVVFQSTIKPGTADTWTADKQIEISGNRIYDLEFEVNGKVIGSLGRADRNAHRVVITKEGLTVKE